MKNHLRDFLLIIATAAPLLGGVAWLLVQHPREDESKTSLGEIRQLAAGRQFEQAQTKLEHYLRSAPDDAQANLLIAQVATDRAQPAPDLALEHLKRIHPESPEKAALIQFFMGKAQYQRARHDLAETCWREALRLDPKVPEAGWALLDLLSLEGRMDEAHDLGLRLHEIEPDPKDRVRLLVEVGRFDIDKSAPGSIVIVFEPIAKQLPDNLTIASTYGLALVLDSRSEKGIEVLRESLKRHPDSADAWDAWLTGLDHAGRIEEHAAEVARLPKSIASDLRFAKHQGLVAQAASDWPAAARAYARAAAKARHDGVLLYRLSRALRLSGKPAESDHIDKLLKDYQTAWPRVREAGNTILALKNLGYEPQPELFQRMADLRERMGRPDDALAWHRLVLRDLPRDPKSLAALARLTSSFKDPGEGPVAPASAIND